MSLKKILTALNKWWWKPLSRRFCSYPYYHICVAKPPRRFQIPSLGPACKADIHLPKAQICSKQHMNWDRQTNEEHRKGQGDDTGSSQICPPPQGQLNFPGLKQNLFHRESYDDCDCEKNYPAISALTSLKQNPLSPWGRVEWSKILKEKETQTLPKQEVQ